MGAALDQLDAVLRRDLGAGLDGPVSLAWQPPNRDPLMRRIVQEGTLVLLADAEHAAKESKDEVVRVSKGAERLAAEVQMREAALAVEKDRAAKQEDELRRELERERSARVAEAAALAEAQRIREEESLSASLRVSKAEALATAERTRAATLERDLEQATKALSTRPAPVQVPAAPVKLKVDAIPEFDFNGSLRSIELNNGQQKLRVRVIRDAAAKPLLLRIE